MDKIMPTTKITPFLHEKAFTYMLVCTVLQTMLDFILRIETMRQQQTTPMTTTF